MKKIMGLVLGMSLAIGAFSFVFAQNSTTSGSNGKKSGAKKGGKKGKKDTTK